MADFPPPFTRVVRDLPTSTPFVAPEALERQSGKPLTLRLGANESAFGPSPKAIAAMQAAVERTNWYADPENYELRATLALHHGVTIENLVVGCGIDGLLELMARAFVEPDVNVVTSLGTYPTFNYHVNACGGALHRIPYREDRPDLERLADTTARVGAHLVYLANPDNPSGNWHTADAVGILIDRLPPGCVLILDEAYAEFAPEGTVPPIDAADSRLIRLRTFSKVYGMAGARIGYAIAAKPIIDGLNKIRNQFEVNRVAQAGALASLGDPEFVRSVVRAVEAGRRDYQSLAAGLGLSTIPSATNFVCIDVGGPDRARAMVAALLERGIFIRMPGEPPLSRCIRVTVGEIGERARLAPAFSHILQRSK